MAANGKNIFVRYSSAIGLLVALVWLGFWLYCFQTAPRAPNAEQGKVYDVNYHGTIIYLSRVQLITLYAIPGVGLVIGIATGLTATYWKRS